MPCAQVKLIGALLLSQHRWNSCKIWNLNV